MVDPWQPDHPVDSDLAARQGWDNDVWRVGDLALRFPRRRFGVDVIEIEAT